MFYYKVVNSSLGSAQGIPPLHVDFRSPPLESLTKPCVFEGPPFGIQVPAPMSWTQTLQYFANLIISTKPL